MRVCCINYSTCSVMMSLCPPLHLCQPAIDRIHVVGDLSQGQCQRLQIIWSVNVEQIRLVTQTAPSTRYVYSWSSTSPILESFDPEHILLHLLSPLIPPWPLSYCYTSFHSSLSLAKFSDCALQYHLQHLFIPIIILHFTLNRTFRGHVLIVIGISTSLEVDGDKA